MVSLLKTGTIGILGTLAASSVIENSMRNYDTDIRPPTDVTSIILATYNEERFIETCVLSLRNQSIIQQYPEHFEIILVDSNSTDRTVEMAEPFVDKVIMAKRGKLTARNMAIDISKGNIVVATDADTYYPEHWLNTLLKPFSDPKYENVVGVGGSTIDYSIPGVPGPIRNILELFDRIIYPNKMLGRNSAFFKHAYFLAGRFDESINQFSVKDMVREEEVGFGNRLGRIGTVVPKINASCLHLGGLKISCRWHLENKDTCSSYGFGKERF